MKLSTVYTTVTPLSKFLALFFFICFMILGFYLGRLYSRAETIRSLLNNQKAEVIQNQR